MILMLSLTISITAANVMLMEKNRDQKMVSLSFLIVDLPKKSMARCT